MIGLGKAAYEWICSWFFPLSMKLYFILTPSLALFYVSAIEDLLFLFFHSATYYFFKTQLSFCHLPAYKA